MYTLAFSKTDQSGKGLEVAVIGKAHRALKDWMELPVISQGPVFRRIYRWERENKDDDLLAETGLSPGGVEHILKNRFQAAGIDIKTFSPHSLRAGFLTQASDDGVPLSEAMKMSGHKSQEVAGRYFRKADALKNQAADLLGGDRADRRITVDLAAVIEATVPYWTQEKKEKFLKQHGGNIRKRLQRELVRSVNELAEVDPGHS